MIFVDDHANTAAAAIFKAAHHSAAAIDLHVCRPPSTSAGSMMVKSTSEPTGTSLSIANSTPLAEMFSVSARIGCALRFHRRRQMQWKPWSTLHVIVVSDVHLVLGHCGFRCCCQIVLAFRLLLPTELL